MPPGGWEATVREKKGSKYAVTPGCGSTDRSRSAVVAGQSLSADAGHDQIDPERGRGDRSGPVAPEHLRVVPLVFSHPHWIVGTRRQLYAAHEIVTTQHGRQLPVKETS